MEDKKRRVLIRLIGAPLIIAALFGILYFDYVRGDWTGLVILVGVMACVSLHELCAMMRLKGIRTFEPVAILALVLLFAGQLPFAREHHWTVGLRYASIAAAVIAAACSGRAVLPCLAATSYAGLAVFLTVWNPYDAPFVTRETSPQFLLFLFATNKGSDMAAYSVGKLIGRHKMAPTISPNKTWEGAIAGLIVGTAAGCLVTGATDAVDILLAAVVTASAQVGDLVKSRIKRWAGVKDSGHLLPEFGGALDMIDSFLISAPVAWLIVQALPKW